MKKFASLAAVGIGALAIGGAGMSQAAGPTTNISGNFQYSSMQYWCDHGTPNFAFSYRTLNKTESSVTFSATGYRPLTIDNVKPYYTSNSIVSLTKVPGRAITVTAKGATTGSSFSVSGRVPTSCAGLPTTEPVTTWVGKPTAQPVPTKTTTPAPTKPAPTKPAPTQPMPGNPSGPKVDTDRVATSGSSNSTALAAGLGSVALVAAGGTLAVRRGRQ